MECSEEKKMKLTTFLLQGSAEDWWTLHAARVRALFRGRSSEKRFKISSTPCSFYNAKMNEFISLVQCDMTVAKYEKKFTELVKYALTFVTDEKDKCKRFEDSL